MKRQNFVEIACFLFILLFVYAATSKLIDYQKFRVQLGQSPMLTSFAGFIAWFIPVMELFIAIALSLTRYKLIGLYASFSLMTMFTAYIYILTHYSSYVPCSCGGVLQKMSWNQHFIFNLFFTALGVAAILLFRPPQEQVNTVYI
jgi:hypothetical protein